MLGTNYQLIAITLGMILIGAAVFGPIPFAVADDDDREEKLKKLKELLRQHRDKNNDKCPDRFKYNPGGGSDTEVCDREKPKVDFIEPDKFERLPAGTISFEVEARDMISGIDIVELRVIRSTGNLEMNHVSGDTYELDVELERGWKVAIAKAIDMVGNSKRDLVVFRVI